MSGSSEAPSDVFVQADGFGLSQRWQVTRLNGEAVGRPDQAQRGAIGNRGFQRRANDVSEHSSGGDGRDLRVTAINSVFLRFR